MYRRTGKHGLPRIDTKIVCSDLRHESDLLKDSVKKLVQLRHLYSNYAIIP